MFENTKDFINRHNLFAASDKLLLAVSGGIDSMVMLDILRKQDYKIHVAHCNFSLRGVESDKDQSFVKDYCKRFNIPFFTRNFDTIKYAEEKGLSIQMAARDMRYRWFEEIRSYNNFDAILLGHNWDDVIETFFINLARGTGIKGLTGIKPSNKRLARPLLHASREEIEKYASDNKIDYREDSTNIETKYKRNKIRHKIIPLFNELNPSFSSSMEDTIRRLDETQQLVDEKIATARKKVFVVHKNIISAEINKLLELEPLDLYLYELFKDFGIGSRCVGELSKLISSSPGKSITTGSHTILRDREELLISDAGIEGREASDTLIINNIRSIPGYSLEVVNSEGLKISSDKNTAYLDYDLVKLPLIIRGWEEGDWFYPLGMEGKKKLSDFFIDQKIALIRKNDVPIFLSEGKIIWIAGYRIDKRFRISDQTRKVLVISKIK